MNRFELASIKRMINNARMVSKDSNHSIFYVLIDMSKCILKDNIGYMEYNLFNFVDKPDNLRKTYLDFNHSQALFNMLNDRNYTGIFSDKLKFNERFKDYIGREFIDAAHCSLQEFKEYIKGKNKIFCKPTDSCSGKGIYKSIDIDENTDIEQLHKFMIDNNLFCEDCIEQHSDMNKLSKHSINTIRVVTILSDNEVIDLYEILRVGIGKSKVDNVASGGIYTVLSKDGVIVNPMWSDKTITTYTVHPTNGFKMIGFKIPYFKEAVELCKKAAKVEPHVRYVGWDVAISPNGPVIVEGNELPGYDMAQNHHVSGSDSGLLPEIEKIVGKIKIN